MSFKTICISYSPIFFNKIYEIAKNSLIKEKIKKIEILKKYKKIDLENPYIKNTMINFHSKLGVKNLDEFKKLLVKENIIFNDINNKIAIQSYWNNLILSKYSDKIKIDKKKIKKEIIAQGKNKTKSFLLSEIVFEVKNLNNLERKFSEINENIIKNGFANSALIYSISMSSENGGNIGWISEKSLNENIKNQLLELKLNEYTKPIKIPSGYLILKINKIKENLVENNINLEEELKKVINEKTNQQLNNFSNLYFNKIKKNIQIEKI